MASYANIATIKCEMFTSESKPANAANAQRCCVGRFSGFPTGMNQLTFRGHAIIRLKRM